MEAGANKQSQPAARPPNPNDASAMLEAMQAVRQAVADIKFGIVQITIHDGRIVQIEKTEKIRLT